MSKSQGKARAVSSQGFGNSSARGAFGGFSTGSSGSSLSYLAEPPDFTTISDANVVVSFKNLLKKDSTTKTKALEDLVAYTQAHPYEQNGGVEESVLEAWVQLYPRTSIDNSRRVRELSHSLQLELVKSARKRMEKRIPRIVGSWMAGNFDKDRVVAQAARDGLSSFLNTDEKVLQFWKRCQTQILDFAIEAIQETPDTLSDERSTTADDAEAKYLRVVGGSLSLVLGLLSRLPDADLEVANDKYDEFFSVEAVWACATANDAVVRKTVFQLLWACLERRDEALKSHFPRLSKILISEGLKTTQTGSAMEYATILTKLTEKHPEVWGTKKSPLARISGFLERGSQLSGPKYWERLLGLLEALPLETVSFEEARDALRALKAGVTTRETNESIYAKAWDCYLKTFSRFIRIVTPESSRVRLAEESLFPLMEHFLYPKEKSPWPLRAQKTVMCQAYTMAILPGFSDVASALEQEWVRLSDILVSHLSNSLPEVSKDFPESQRKVAEEAERWFVMVGFNHGSLRDCAAHLPPNTREDRTVQPSIKVLSSAVDLLKRRNYKPFGAAMLLYHAIVSASHLFEGENVLLLSSLFSSSEVPTILSSPSVPYLWWCINCIHLINPDLYKSIWSTVIKAILDQRKDQNAISGITKLISGASANSLAHNDADLQGYLVKACMEAAQGHEETFELLETVFASGSLTEENAKQVAQVVIDLLDSNDPTFEASFRAIEAIIAKQPSIVMLDEDLHLSLVAKLLVMTEISDQNISSKASTLRSLMDKQSKVIPSVVNIIEKELLQATPKSLEIDTLFQQAAGVLEAGKVSPDQLFPNTNVWMSKISGPFRVRPNPSLSITSHLGGAYYLAAPMEARPLLWHRDRNGATVPARMAMYTSKLLSSGVDLSTLPQSYQVELLFLLHLSAEMASDKLVIPNLHSLWGDLREPGLSSNVEEFVSTTRQSLNSMVAQAKSWRPGSGSTVLDDLITTLLRESKELTPLGLYSAKVLCGLLQAFSETHGLRPEDEEWITKLDIMKATPTTVFSAVAIIIGYGETIASSKSITNPLNRLVSDVAGAKPQAEKTMMTLVLLNACMSIYDVGELPVANNRLVFAVKQITSWFEEPSSLDPNLAAEACRSLQRLLPCVKDVYGPYWERSIEFCIGLWDQAAREAPERRLAYLHASLKLIAGLEAIHEPNDDLEDAIKSFAESKSRALIELLKLPRFENSQPADIVDALLCRLVEKIPLEHVSDLSDLYSLIASESRDIQTAAFSILHRALPAAQEQLSLDVLLEKKDARLPDELLSLLLGAPTLEAYPDDVLVHFPTPVRSYLLSWHLVFDAYSKASYKVRNDYTENLKASNYVTPLLEFTFDVLGHSASHPLNLDKEGFTIDFIQSYDAKLGDAEPEERNMHWLLVHLYYLTLKYIPGLFRSWYIDCRSKQTKIAVESWMTRYFSPIIISETLDEVDTWSQSQEAPADDEKELLVKVSRAGKEVTAGYEVDELQASIAIKIPASYPLEGVTVVGVNRVAVNEKKWQSWLMTTQGVITFSNGSIIDGLTTFRRNVIGALKGQSECAICYSIISTDKKMPDKRCQTCKNLFHRTCLYKWFQTSNQNTCPLCRNPIDYLGADTKSRRGGPV